IPAVAKTSGSDWARSIERRLLSGSMPAQTSLPTPALRAAATASAGSPSIRNRWQWVSTAASCAGGSGWEQAMDGQRYRLSTSARQATDQSEKSDAECPPGVEGGGVT